MLGYNKPEAVIFSSLDHMPVHQHHHSWLILGFITICLLHVAHQYSESIPLNFQRSTSWKMMMHVEEACFSIHYMGIYHNSALNTVPLAL